jgi:hypothetical protein
MVDKTRSLTLIWVNRRRGFNARRIVQNFWTRRVVPYVTVAGRERLLGL